MKKINSLKKLRDVVSNAVSEAIPRMTQCLDIKKSPYGQIVGNSGFKSSRVVVVVNEEMDIRVCFRSEKADDELEIAVIRKDIFFDGGLTSAYWDKVIPTYAKKLCDVGMYVERDVITDETPCIPGLEGFAEKVK